MKKLNKFFAVLVALAMMATLCVSMAFAADTNAQVSTDETDVNASVKKTLVVPEGTTVDDLAYELSFKKQSCSGRRYCGLRHSAS